MSIKMNVSIKSNINTILKSKQKKIDRIPVDAYKFFVKETPIRSGNARRNTQLKGKKEIIANYPYAQRLDQGYSKQSPEGMTQPTSDFIVNEFIQIMTGKK